MTSKRTFLQRAVALTLLLLILAAALLWKSGAYEISFLPRKGAETDPETERQREYGGIAQLGERLNGIQEVSGSIPLISTKGYDERLVSNRNKPLPFIKLHIGMMLARCKAIQASSLSGSFSIS